MTLIYNNVQAIQREIAQAHKATPHQAIEIIAVSKGQTVQAMREASQAGLRAFGENYLQEALDKMAQLQDLNLEWHFIGPVQSNKTRLIAQHFSWVHSVDRLRIAQRLNEARAGLAPLNICIEVNSSGETSKHGLPPDEVLGLAQAVQTLPHIKLRGLMTIPAADVQTAQSAFQSMRELFDTLNQQYLALDTLSMGMSQDFPLAIAYGATMVRIGTALFGVRQPGSNT